MRLWITGYRSYEFPIFNNDDPRVAVIRFALKRAFINAFDDGLEWVITGGQLGVEQWAAMTAVALRDEYPELHVSMMLPYAEFSHRWKEDKQVQLATLQQQVDFHANVSDQPYQSPAQLRDYQRFMLSHTDAALLVYDQEYPGKPKYDYAAIERWQQQHDYPCTLIDMDQLQSAATEYAAAKNDLQSW